MSNYKNYIFKSSSSFTKIKYFLQMKEINGFGKIWGLG